MRRSRKTFFKSKGNYLFSDIDELMKFVTMHNQNRDMEQFFDGTLRNLNFILKNFDSSIKEREKIQALWTNNALLALMKFERAADRDDEFMARVKKKVEKDYVNNTKVIFQLYGSSSNFFQDYFAFLSMINLWKNYGAVCYFLDLLPPDTILIDELLMNITTVIVRYQYKKNYILVNNIANTVSYVMFNKQWNISNDCQNCIGHLLHVVEFLYEYFNEDNSLHLINSFLSWMRYLIEQLHDSQHLSNMIESISKWLYFHSTNVHQVVNIGSLLYLCCESHRPLSPKVHFAHAFQDVVLSMINSNELRTVSLGYDIFIMTIDQLGNRNSLTNVKIYHPDNVYMFKRPSKGSLTRLFARDDLIYMFDLIHKVMVNSVNRFISDRILSQKVFTVVSLLAIEGCDSAQGLMSVISLALSIQHIMLEKSRRNSIAKSLGETVRHPDFDTLFYHACVASWFSLLSYMNAGDLDLLKNYVQLVIDLRSDSAPYLLPSYEGVVLLPHYIYELDKSLYFDVEKVEAAVEGSWVVLSREKDLLHYIKIPRSKMLVEKYVDLQLLDGFDSYRNIDNPDERGDAE